MAAACHSCDSSVPEKKVYKVYHKMQSPYRLVVRMSCRGRDNPDSTPGGDIWMLRDCELAIPELFQDPPHGPLYSPSLCKFFKEAARPEKMCEARVDILTEDLKVPGSIPGLGTF